MGTEPTSATERKKKERKEKRKREKRKSLIIFYGFFLNAI